VLPCHCRRGSYVLGSALLSTRDHESAPSFEAPAIAPAVIMLFSYSSAAMTLTAQRSMPGAAFVVQVPFTDGRPARRCIASAYLTGRLRTFSHLVVKREISMEERG
jgi:hypothetical protein